MNALAYLSVFVKERFKKGHGMDGGGLVVEEGEEIFQEFEKENAVQGIFKESVEVEINSDVIPRHPPCDVSDLTESLVLCSASAVNPNALDALNISCVINVAPELPDTPLHRDDVIYFKIPVMDSGSSRISAHFDEAADLIQRVANSGGKALVYCVAGVSRSASVCLAYLMKHHQLSLLDSYNYVKLRRPKIKPNCSFFKQLIEYEKTVFGANTVRMVFNEFVRMEIPDVYDCEYRFVDQLKKRRDQNGRH